MRLAVFPDGDAASAPGAVGAWPSGAVTVSDTATVCGDPCAPAAVTVTFVEYAPAARPVMSAETVAVAGPVPLPGATASHAAPGEALHWSAPVPPFEIPSDCDGGFAPPTDPLKVRLAGLTTSTGATAALPYTEKGPSLNADPVVHVPGRVVRPVPDAVSAAVPLPQQRSRNLIVPVGPSSAIQYVVPEAIGTEVSGMSFQAPAVGAFSVPCVSRAPGWPEAFVYTPATTREAVDPAST